MSDQATLSILEDLAKAAGTELMHWFRGAYEQTEKADGSPTTTADVAAEQLILAGLAAHFADTPVVAEECAPNACDETSYAGEFFLVDALDGTREFVAGRTDFTVNIGLVRGRTPVLGVVYAPARGVLFSACSGQATMQVPDDGGHWTRTAIHTRTPPQRPTVVISRRPRCPDTHAYLTRLGDPDIRTEGSSLKFCLIASGQADFYPRYGRTMEWDTAAGHAVLAAAGGRVLGIDGQPLGYGKVNGRDADFANPSFIADGGTCHPHSRAAVASRTR
jgi:3'(2'), 5'-bisphosphate nucleotidase